MLWRVTVHVRGVESWYQDVQAPDADEAVATFLLQAGLPQRPPSHWHVTADPAPPKEPKPHA